MKTFLIARASSPTQSLTAQITELKAAYPSGEVISGYRSGVSAKNKEALLGYLDLCEPSDKLVFLRLSRVCRSLEQFLWFFKAAEKKQVHIVLLKDNVDFSTATGRMHGKLLMVIIAWQREIQLENCREGRKAKENSKGFKGWGRKSSLSKARVARIVKATGGGQDPETNRRGRKFVSLIHSPPDQSRKSQTLQSRPSQTSERKNRRPQPRIRADGQQRGDTISPQKLFLYHRHRVRQAKFVRWVAIIQAPVSSVAVGLEEGTRKSSVNNLV